MLHSRRGIIFATVIATLALTAAAVPTDADDPAEPGLTASAAVTGYLRIEGIEGGATAPGYEGWMEVVSFEWKVSNTATAGAGARTAGQAEFGPLTVVKRIDRATPLLAQACASGRHHAEAELVYFAGSSTSPSGTVRLRDVVISASLTGSGEAEQETLSLNFGRVEWTYGNVTAGWDVAANRPM